MSDADGRGPVDRTVGHDDAQVIGCELCPRVFETADDEAARAAGWRKGWDGWCCAACCAALDADPMTDALAAAGYEVAQGADDVRALIGTAAAGVVFGPLCSGFGVLPGGERCKGCADCGPPPRAGRA